MNPNHDKLHIVTGGPGSGKSTLVQALANVGLLTMPEAGRHIIQDQLAIGGDALPWRDRLRFGEHMLTWEMRSYRAGTEAARTVIFDRGISDVMGYLRLCDLPIPSHVARAAETFRYNRRVLIAPPWPEIFIQDEERKQTYAEAFATYEALVEVYSSLDYELIELPRTSVEERVNYVTSAVIADGINSKGPKA